MKREKEEKKNSGHLKKKEYIYSFPPKRFLIKSNRVDVDVMCRMSLKNINKSMKQKKIKEGEIERQR